MIKELTLNKNDKYYNLFAVMILLVLGIYQSCILFGHKMVPISDFSSFVDVGHEILALKFPSNFKRVPLVGVLQILFGKITGGQFPDLQGGWLLNSVLHPLCLILLWLIGKKVIGKAAVWFAIIVSIIPWILYMLREPLAETPLLFFILLTIYLIYNNSRFSYLTAALTTMVRYEGAALILAAFIMNIIYRKSNREIYISILCSVIASMPLFLWLSATFISSASFESTSHYLSFFVGEDAKKANELLSDTTGIGKHLYLIWNVGYRSLFMLNPNTSQEWFNVLFIISKFTAIISFAFGSIFGLIRKNWQILILLIFLIPYFLIHAYYPFPIPRFHATSFWIALLISIFGLQQIWNIINIKISTPEAIKMILSAIILILAILMILPLLSYMPNLAEICGAVKWLPCVTICLVFILILVRCFLEKFKNVLQCAAIGAMLSLIVISNQFSLTPLLGDGQQDIEFKYLADWYIENARPNEKMAVYMCGTVKIFAPTFGMNFVNFPDAETPQELVEKLRQENIFYVVWASREGLSKDHYGYHKQNLDKNINFLYNKKNVGPYKFISQIRSKNGYINIFRLI